VGEGVAATTRRACAAPLWLGSIRALDSRRSLEGNGSVDPFPHPQPPPAGPSLSARHRALRLRTRTRSSSPGGVEPGARRAWNEPSRGRADPRTGRFDRSAPTVVDFAAL